MRHCRRNCSLDHLGHDLLPVLCLLGVVVVGVGGKWGLLKSEGHQIELHVERERTKRLWIVRARKVLKEYE